MKRRAFLTKAAAGLAAISQDMLWLGSRTEDKHP